MKRIIPYKIFEDNEKMWAGVQHEFNIYDWFEDLKSYQRGGVNNPSGLKMWSDHFIGEGWFDKVKSHVDKIYNSLKPIDVEYINDRMVDIYDEFAVDKKKWVSPCVLHGDVERIGNPIRSKFNGMIFAGKLENDNDWKFHIIVHILKEMVYPTLMHVSGISFLFRQGRDEQFVTDKKYQCCNFNPINYRGGQLETEYGLKKMQEYDINKFLPMYQPGINIQIGGYDDHHTNEKMNLRDIEKAFDIVMPSILHDIDYKEVIYDCSRFDRRFDDNTDIYEYSVKILLNL
jgi:hypothetical protein